MENVDNDSNDDTTVRKRRIIDSGSLFPINLQKNLDDDEVENSDASQMKRKIQVSSDEDSDDETNEVRNKRLVFSLLLAFLLWFSVCKTKNMVFF